MAKQSHQHEENWSAAGMVGMFDAVHRERDRKRYRRGVLLWTLSVAVSLGIPLWVMWGKFQDARRLTLLEEYATHRQQAEQLTHSNSAVASAVAEADALRQSVGTQNAAESVAALRRAIELLAQAEDLDRDARRIRQLLDPIGETLLKTPWHVTSRKVDREQQRLSEQHKSIVAMLAEGNVPQAETAMALLLKETGELQRDNVEAMNTSIARQRWVRLQAAIPDRLRDNPAWGSINDVGRDAESGWNEGDWNESRTLYARATERAQQFLDAQLDPEEKTKLMQSDTDAVARLETEKNDLQNEVTRLEAQITRHNQQLASLVSERQAALDHVKGLTSERDRLQADTAKQAAEIATLRPLQSQLKDSTAAMQATRKQVAELTDARQTAEESLETVKRQLAARVAEVEALRTAAASGSGNSVVAQVSATLAAIDSQLAAEVEGKNAEAAAKLARERLVDALAKYDQAVALKQQALAEKYLPTSSHVKSIEATISQAEATLASIFKVLEEPLAGQFDQLQVVITAAESDYQKLLQEVAPEHKDALKLEARINRLKIEQGKLLMPHDWHTGKQFPSTDDLLSVCREQVLELLADRQKAEYSRLRDAGKVPTAANMDFVYIGPGTFRMGSRYPSDAEPAHDVRITKRFFAGECEVTVGQALAWLNSGATINPDWVTDGGEFSPVKKSGSRWVRNSASALGESDRQPMCCISWHGAKAFCEWCSKQDSRFVYRLPTEAEWEYMARAGSTTQFPWGDSIEGYQANVGLILLSEYISNGRPQLQKTVEVGSYQPNSWGLYDTVGNVFEWCEDVYDENFYNTSAARQPDPVNRGSGLARVQRGGSWCIEAEISESGCRMEGAPDNQDGSSGFRVVAE